MCKKVVLCATNPMWRCEVLTVVSTKILCTGMWCCIVFRYISVFWRNLQPQSSHILPWRWRHHIPPKHCYLSSKHSITSSIFLLFFHEDGSDKFPKFWCSCTSHCLLFIFLLWIWRSSFLWNIFSHLSNNIASHPKRHNLDHKYNHWLSWSCVSFEWMKSLPSLDTLNMGEWMCSCIFSWPRH